MNHRFSWAYKLSEQDEQDLFNSAEFFFDTNALLKVYSVNDDIAIKVIDAISKFKNRIHITNHVAVEYHWNVIEKVADYVTEIQKQIEIIQSEELFNKIFNTGFQSCMPKEELSRYKDIVDGLRIKSLELLHKRKEKCEKEFSTMNLANRICNELTGCLFNPLPDETYAKLRIDFEQRAKDKIPPGYKDDTQQKRNKKREGISNEAGDYIIWEEIIDWVRKEKKDVIFVSNDLKEDWIWKINGLKIGPRWELKKQFFNESGGKKFHILTLDRFLALTAHFSPEEIEEVREAVILSAQSVSSMKLTQPDMYPSSYEEDINSLKKVNTNMSESDHFLKKDGVVKSSDTIKIEKGNEYIGD